MVNGWMRNFVWKSDTAIIWSILCELKFLFFPVTRRLTIKRFHDHEIFLSLLMFLDCIYHNFDIVWLNTSFIRLFFFFFLVCLSNDNCNHIRIQILFLSLNILYDWYSRKSSNFDQSSNQSTMKKRTKPGLEWK